LGLTGTNARNQINHMASPNHVHITLLGDSIFDNEVYVKSRAQSVTGVLERRLLAINKDWSVTNAAVDGSLASGVARQIPRVPKDTTHIYLSTIGNNCLGALYELQSGSDWKSVARNPTADNPVLANIMSNLASEYDAALKEVKTLNLPVVAVNLYAPRYDTPSVQAFCKIAVQLLNSRLKLVAAEHNIPVIDIFSLFTDHDDYANAIEPGAKGSEKIGKAIEDSLLELIK